MKRLLHIPPINPIRFFDQRVGKNQRVDNYVQKYSPFDLTDLQLASVGVEYDALLTIENKYHKTIKTIEPAVSVLGENDYFFYTFSISFFDLSGLYRFVVTGTSPDALPQKFISGNICVSEDNEELTLLHYRNTENCHDINFDAIDLFSLRTEGGFLMKNYSPKSTDVVYQNQGGQFELLFSAPYRTKIFTVGDAGGTEDDFHYIIHNVWSCDTVYVDGKRYVKHEGATWNISEIDNYPKRAWTLEVVERDGELLRVFSSDYICQIETSEPENPDPLTITVTPDTWQYIPATGATQDFTVTVTGENADWDVQSIPEWITFEKDGETLTLTVDENTETSERMCEVVLVHSLDSSLMATINISQPALVLTSISFVSAKQTLSINLDGSGPLLHQSGRARIDWGDGMSEERAISSASITTPVTKTYSNASTRTITISTAEGHYIRELRCIENGITSIDISNYTALQRLSVDINQLTNLDISKNNNLIRCTCFDNPLTSLTNSLSNNRLASIMLEDCQLSASALNAIFNTLHNNAVTSELQLLGMTQKRIMTYGNPGANSSNRDIATNKGWYVGY